MEWSLVKRKLLTRNQPFSGLMIIVLDEDCYYQTLRVEGNSSYKIYVLFTKLTGTVHMSHQSLSSLVTYSASHRHTSPVNYTQLLKSPAVFLLPVPGTATSCLTLNC